jgi:hypothetical protein
LSSASPTFSPVCQCSEVIDVRMRWTNLALRSSSSAEAGCSATGSAGWTVMDGTSGIFAVGSTTAAGSVGCNATCSGCIGGSGGGWTTGSTTMASGATATGSGAGTGWCRLEEEGRRECRRLRRSLFHRSLRLRRSCWSARRLLRDVGHWGQLNGSDGRLAQRRSSMLSGLRLRRSVLLKQA